MLCSPRQRRIARGCITGQHDVLADLGSKAAHATHENMCPCNAITQSADPTARGTGVRSVESIGARQRTRQHLHLELFVTGHALLSVKTPQPDLAVILPVEVRIAVARAVSLRHGGHAVKMPLVLSM